MLIEEIKKIDYSKKALKKFGFTFSIIFLLLGIILYLNKTESYYYFLIICILFFISTIYSQKILKPIYKIWMIIALILGLITTNIILTLFFYLIITPIGFVIKISGKDLLNLKFDKEKESYWNRREAGEYIKENSEKQY
ncbi:SxtJ family membrane protein [Rosettibacter firmus]|uniref:SxtJ family membrane protein n=1 Tax=Rosettibacter firmus TaxID=3111522 RepID=UPI00336C1710